MIQAMDQYYPWYNLVFSLVSLVVKKDGTCIHWKKNESLIREELSPQV